MDGRVQHPVFKFSQKRFNAAYVDTITEAGPSLILAQQTDHIKIRSIIERLEISIKNHDSVGIVIVGHHDCAGNPIPKDEQINQLRQSIKFIQSHFQDVEVIGIWVDENWNVNEID